LGKFDELDFTNFYGNFSSQHIKRYLCKGTWINCLPRIKYKPYASIKPDYIWHMLHVSQISSLKRELLISTKFKSLDWYLYYSKSRKLLVAIVTPIKVYSNHHSQFKTFRWYDGLMYKVVQALNIILTIYGPRNIQQHKKQY